MHSAFDGALLDTHTDRITKEEDCYETVAELFSKRLEQHFGAAVDCYRSGLLLLFFPV